MRKPENREKFKAAIEAIIAFYGKRDTQMVAEVLDQEAEKAKELEKRRELKKMRQHNEEGGANGRLEGPAE